MKPIIGEKATCVKCNRPIYFNGEHWMHEGKSKPRHPARPRTKDEFESTKPSNLLENARVTEWEFRDRSLVSMDYYGCWEAFSPKGELVTDGEFMSFATAELAAAALEKVGHGPAMKGGA